jgi:hypothetical protein
MSTKTAVALCIVVTPTLVNSQVTEDPNIVAIMSPGSYSRTGKVGLMRDNRRSDYDNRLYRLSYFNKQTKATVTAMIAFGDYSKLPTEMGQAMGDELGVSRVDWTRGLPTRATFDGAAIHSVLNGKKANNCTIVVGDELCAVVLSFTVAKSNDAKAPAESLARHFHTEIKRLFRVTGTGETAESSLGKPTPPFQLR